MKRHSGGLFLELLLHSKHSLYLYCMFNVDHCHLIVYYGSIKITKFSKDTFINTQHMFEKNGSTHFKDSPKG